MKKYNVFVYGTLKQGYGNHNFLENSEFVGNAYTFDKYSLYIDNIPFVVNVPVSHIQGELYRVDQKTLSEVDRLEGHPYFYKRKRVNIKLESGKLTRGWLYFGPESIGKLEPSGKY